MKNSLLNHHHHRHHHHMLDYHKPNGFRPSKHVKVIVRAAMCRKKGKYCGSYAANSEFSERFCVRSRKRKKKMKLTFILLSSCSTTHRILSYRSSDHHSHTTLLCTSCQIAFSAFAFSRKWITVAMSYWELHSAFHREKERVELMFSNECRSHLMVAYQLLSLSLYLNYLFALPHTYYVSGFHSTSV